MPDTQYSDNNMFNNTGIKDKVVIITGGARGIGRATVNLFAQAQANVYFFYHHSAEQAQAMQHEAETNNLKITAMCVDVRDKNQCEVAINKIYAETNRIDVLVYN